MTQKEYNGWTNYETWNVALWLDNDEGSQGYWQSRAQEAYDMAEAGEVLNREEEAVRELENELKASFENQEQDLLERANAQCSVWADLLGAALSEVNWQEIAEHYIAECDKESETV